MCEGRVRARHIAYAMGLNGRRERTRRALRVTLYIVVVAVLLVIAVAAVLRRVGGGSRAEEHAMERHGHALGVLGDVSRHGDAKPQVRIVREPDVAKIHISPTEEGTTPVPRPMGEDVPPPRIRLEPPTAPGAPADAPLAFGTPIHGTPAVPRLDPEERSPIVLGDDAERSGVDERHSGRLPGRPGPVPRPRPIGRTHHEQVVRRRATAGAAVVLVAALAVLGVELAGHGGTPKTAGHSSRGELHQSGVGTSTLPPLTSTTSPPATTTTLPTTIAPERTSASEVSYRAPATRYTVTFTASGPCWIGIQQAAGGPWVWEETVAAGQSQTYTATGAVIIRLGAPPEIKVAIDGITVQLPPSNVQPYDVTFTPTA